ncbi:hypothetical protein MSAN_00638400 [Mycena sanguinolenta]|uniref:Uncharacterized protein n=1 Tax=Mycena sanguinolenta TaxID=230812 RepID=A0A8H6Z3Y3_9AGAR|nr:hypothetical protein MSAN_00638400 [Mycena sanguinolenta]
MFFCACPRRPLVSLTPMATLAADEYDPYQEAHSLPHSSATLSPNRATYEKSGREMARTERTTPTWTIVLTGVVIILAVCLIAMGLIIQIFGVHTFHLADRAVYTTAPLGRTLAIAHLTSLVVSVSVPITIGLSAYSFAGRWIAASRVESIDRPTPYQLGIMMKSLNGANLSALWAGSNYIAGRRTGPGGKSLRSPPMLRQAVWMLLFFLALGYSITFVETWLSTSSLSVPYPVTDIVQGSFPLLGHAVNQTMCDQVYPNNQPYQCGLIQGSGGNPQAASLQVLTMNGLSHTTDIAFTEEDSTLAIMVPPTVNLSTSMGWVAPTLGVKSTCTSVTSQCIDMGNLGPDAGLITNCPASVNFNTTGIKTDFCPLYGGSSINNVYGGPLSADGLPMLQPCFSTPANSTSFRWGAEVNSQAYHINYTDSGETFVGDTGFFLHGNGGGYNVLTCVIESLNVTYHYYNGTYNLLSSVPTDLDQARRLLDGSWAALVYVPNSVDGAGLYSGSYEDAFAAQLSLVTLSTTAYVIQPVETIRTENTTVYTGSRILLAPFLLLFTLILIYCVSVGIITIDAARQNNSSPHTSLALGRLLDPTTAVGTAYGPAEAKHKATRTAKELFGNETPADRLNIIVDAPDGLPIVRRGTGTGLLEDESDSEVGATGRRGGSYLDTTP